MSAISSPFLLTIIEFLEPYFAAAGIDIAAARAEIVETLGSYGTRSRSEILNTAQIIAFGMSTLDTLKEAKGTEMSPSMRVRYRGCANGLSRSGQQNEKALALRLACDLPGAMEPVNDVSDASAQEAVEQARAKIDSYRNRLSGGRLGTGVHPVPGATVSGSRIPGSEMPEFKWPASKFSAAEEARNNRMWGDAMIQVLGDMGMPVQPVASAGSMPHAAVVAATSSNDSRGHG